MPIPGYRPARYYGTDVDSLDWTGLPPDQIVGNVIGELDKNGRPDNPIILLHSVGASRAYDTIVAPFFLPRSTPKSWDLLRALRDLGYDRFERLPRPTDPINEKIGRNLTGHW